MRNDPALTTRAVASLQRVLGKENVAVAPYVTGSEDFAFYGQQVPAFFFFVGATPVGQDPVKAPSNHSPLFYLDEGSLPVGLRTLLGVAVDYLQGVKPD